MQDFIQTANQLGQQKRPFVFLIDFEQQKPLILLPEQAAASGLFFKISKHTNTPLKKITKPLVFNKFAMPFEQYQQGFDLVTKEIQAGNSYLLNLTYPSEIQTNYDLDEIYFASEAKYKIHLQNQFVCFSPECFIKINNNQIFSYPMKGTINALLPDAKKQLLSSEKELSEHNTIVDLIRNDLAIVAKNIQVTRYRYLEKINTERGSIYQTSSEICGELAPNWQAELGSILSKLLPAGSISGAPKVKTVEIIQKAEQQKRGYYTGVFGYFDGENLESAVAIRYIEKRDSHYYFRSGGGITIMSDVKQEYNEILEKVYVPISAF